MKRLLTLFIALALVASPVASAEATTRVERTVEGSYGPYPSPVTGCNSPLGYWYCLSVPTSTSESFFTAKVTDTHGQPVFVEVKVNGRTVAHFCGQTTQPVSFFPGDELHFYVGLPGWDVQLTCPANSVKTTGTISVTLSNLA